MTTKALTGFSEVFYTKVRNRKGYAIQNETKVVGRTPSNAIIKLSVYEVDGAWFVSGEVKEVGTFDPRFMQGPFASNDEAMAVVKAL